MTGFIRVGICVIFVILSFLDRVKSFFSAFAMNVCMLVRFLIDVVFP